MPMKRGLSLLPVARMHGRVGFLEDMQH